MIASNIKKPSKHPRMWHALTRTMTLIRGRDERPVLEIHMYVSSKSITGPVNDVQINDALNEAPKD